MAAHGKNKGKKYRKLVGGEVATKESLRAARAFMGWFGTKFETLRDVLIYAHKFDDEVATDTALKIYQDIELKGLVINGKYKWYYLRAYHTNFVAAKKREGVTLALVKSIDEEVGDFALIDTLVADEYDCATFEACTDILRAEVLEYVRGRYSHESVSLFEIYMELQPEISYKKLAQLLGMPHQKIWQAIGSIKRDVVAEFEGRRAYLLSIT